MQHFINSVLRIVKWPVAVLSVLLLPGGCLAFVGVVLAVAGAWEPMTPFLLGAGAYMVAWYFFFRRPGMGSVLSTLEHEITHSVLALATFHMVTSLKTSWSEGGHMTFRGEGNWLIAIAPYFFPTLSLAVMFAMVWVDPGHLPIASGILGATFTYHATSTYRETHRQQTDLIQVGFPFAWCFLPGANVVSYGLILSAARAGVSGSQGFLLNTWQHTLDLATHLQGLAGGQPVG
ncbi:MAG: hypothetical protein VX938_09945 [Myxococcota bacterium]|nr:hypothetical protein [Myxococcota bacterium]